MVTVPHSFVVVGILSTAAAVGTAGIAWHQRASPGAREYAAVMSVLAVWSALYVGQLVTPTIPAKRPWLVARHAVTPLIGILFWTFAARYTDRPGLLSNRYTVPLAAVGAAIAALAVWNPGSVYWVALSPAVTASLPVADIDFGPAFWLNAGYTLGLVVAGHVFIVSMFQESLDIYRPQLTAMTTVGVIEVGLTVLFLSEHLSGMPTLNPWPHIQLITYGTTLAVLPLGWSYIDGALFTLQPLARRTVIENMADAVFIFDRTDRLRYTNSAARRLLDTPDETDIDGGSVDTVFADRPTLRAEYRRSDIDTGIDREPIELRVSGETRHYDLRQSTITNSLGLTTGTVVVARDVTERTRQRAELRDRTEALETKTEQLERRNEQLDKFSSFVSHDLRNPIHVAGGYLGLVRKTGDLDKLDEVEAALRRMDEMVGDLRELTRIDQNGLTTEPVSVAATARQAWGNVETGTATLAVAEVAEVDADREFLLHVFENLFRNSVEHGSTSNRTQSGDAVEHGSTSSQREHRTDDSVEHGSDDPGAVHVQVGPCTDGLYVEDDGPGIPEGERESVLEHGYSAASDGTGLGMSIVKTIVEAHGWTIAVGESDDGGARFELTGVGGPVETPPETTQLPVE